MEKKKSLYKHLTVLMAIATTVPRLKDLLAPEADVDEHSLAERFEIDGLLYVKRQIEKRPTWRNFLESISAKSLPELQNKSSSAVLLIRTNDKVFAVIFGYGRHLIDTDAFVQDFGLKTALNVLDHNTLRSVDLHSLEDQPVQKRSQASRESNASVFGIDIFKDVLRAVTGSPKAGISLKNVSGGDAMLSFSAEFKEETLPTLLNELADHYANDHYKTGFSWVDNVRKVKDKKLIDELDLKLLVALEKRDLNVVLTLPEIEKWDLISGFSFTRAKDQIEPTIQLDRYYATLDAKRLSIEGVKADRLHVFNLEENSVDHSVYKCLYFENSDLSKTQILFSGCWYEIENSFKTRINQTLNEIGISDLVFPPIEHWKKDGKSIIESEGDYNARAAGVHGHFLLDKKLVKTDRSTTPIELCDLLSVDRDFIHVKHRKGGSAGLSHLFAQGVVSASAMLGDRNFRKQARKVLGKISSSAIDIVPLDNLKASNYQIVFLILGDESATVKSNLPFFSKVTLGAAFENLSQRGFNVRIAAASKVQRNLVEGVSL
jgi:uncharacterized protein (TIGR04141 family)